MHPAIAPPGHALEPPYDIGFGAVSRPRLGKDGLTSAIGRLSGAWANLQPLGRSGAPVRWARPRPRSCPASPALLESVAG